MRRYRNPKIFDNAQVKWGFYGFFAALRVTARHEAVQINCHGNCFAKKSFKIR